MLAKKFRLKKNDFPIIFKHGYRKGNKNFLIIFNYNKKKYSCFAVIINKKTAKLATIRNKTRRFIYQIISDNLEKIPAGFNIVIICRKPVNDQNKEELKECISQLLKNK